MLTCGFLWQPDLSALMQNPMVQNIMNNPDMMNNIMNNPQLRNMASRFGGGGAGGAGGEGGAQGEFLMGPCPLLWFTTRANALRLGGGMPDIGAMMRDPAMMEMARNFMGGMGGAGRGAGGQ